MKHGDKEKGKASKASGKKSGKAVAASKGSKAETRVETKKQSAGSGSKKVAATKAPAAKVPASKASQQEAGGNGKARDRAGSDSGGFSNPLVAAAFKRAVKKYPNAFRKLSD
jgi:hypothetical protein